MISENFLIGLCAGSALGFALAWAYFRSVRLIRTKHEWYSDPVIRSKYPAEAQRALNEPDTW